MKFAALLAGFWLTVGALTSAPAHASSGCDDGYVGCVLAAPGSFIATVTTAVPAGHSGGGRGGDAAVPPSHTSVKREEIALACSGNTRLDSSRTCVNAATACPRPEDLAYWVWNATFDAVTGQQLTAWRQQQDPLAVCKGPTDPGVPKGPAIAALLARDFQRLVVVRGVVVAHPAGRTLVNLDTRFTTDAADYDLPSLVLLGSRVQIRAHAQRYDWVFGDGSTGEGTALTTHRYLRPGAVGVDVRITWWGTYTVDGGPTKTVQGTAVTTGPVTPLRVSEAHAERVTR